MARGRKPKPVEQKRREGNPGKRPLPDTIHAGGRGAPEKPVGLSTHAEELWDTEVPRLEAAGLLDKADGGVLAQYFEAWAIANTAIDALQGEVTDLTMGGDLRKHPALAAWKDASATMIRIAAEFGLTPSARTRLGMGGAKQPADAGINPAIGPSPRLRAVDNG